MMVNVNRGTSQHRKELRSSVRRGYHVAAYAIVGTVAHVFCCVSTTNYWWLATLPDGESAVAWCNRKLKSNPIQVPASWVTAYTPKAKPMPVVPAELAERSGFWAKVGRLLGIKRAA